MNTNRKSTPSLEGRQLLETLRQSAAKALEEEAASGAVRCHLAERQAGCDRRGRIAGRRSWPRRWR
jgi:hypothetical protein